MGEQYSCTVCTQYSCTAFHQQVCTVCTLYSLYNVYTVYQCLHYTVCTVFTLVEPNCFLSLAKAKANTVVFVLDQTECRLQLFLVQQGKFSNSTQFRLNFCFIALLLYCFIALLLYYFIALLFYCFIALLLNLSNLRFREREKQIHRQIDRQIDRWTDASLTEADRQQSVGLKTIFFTPSKKPNLSGQK